MVWDGHCTFCRYWIIRWQKITGESVRYKPYSEVANQFPDIDVKAFQQAVRLIEPDGKIFSGAGAAYRSFTYGKRWGWLWTLYHKNSLFKNISDRAYTWIAKHRPFMFRITRIFFGKNPEKPRPYWLIYLILILVLLSLL